MLFPYEAPETMTMADLRVGVRLGVSEHTATYRATYLIKDSKIKESKDDTAPPRKKRKLNPDYEAMQLEAMHLDDSSNYSKKGRIPRDDDMRLCGGYESTNSDDGQPMVIKFLDWPTSQMPLFVEEWIKLKAKHHYALVKTYGVFDITSTCVVPQGLPFRPMSAVVTEYCNGGNLDDWQNRSCSDANDKRHVFKSIVEAVARLHELGLIHGNLKGSNVVIDEGEPKVCDRMIIRGHGTQPFRLSPYSAPEERISRGESFHVQSDSFSLGVLMAQIFTEPGPFAEWTTSVLRWTSPDQLPVFVDNPAGGGPPYVKFPESIVLDSEQAMLLRAVLVHCIEKRMTTHGLRNHLRYTAGEALASGFLRAN